MLREPYKYLLKNNQKRKLDLHYFEEQNKDVQIPMMTFPKYVYSTQTQGTLQSKLKNASRSWLFKFVLTAVYAFVVYCGNHDKKETCCK